MRLKPHLPPHLGRESNDADLLSQVARSRANFRFTIPRNTPLFREAGCNVATVNHRERVSRKDVQIVAMTCLAYGEIPCSRLGDHPCRRIRASPEINASVALPSSGCEVAGSFRMDLSLRLACPANLPKRYDCPA